MDQDKIENVKNVLNQYRRATSMVDDLNRQIEDMRRSIGMVRSSQMTGMPRGGTPITIADKIADLDELERRRDKFKVVAHQKREIVQSYIDTVMSPRHNYVLTLYFIRNATIEEIAEAKSYSARQIFRIYAEALEMVDLSLDL